MRRNEDNLSFVLLSQYRITLLSMLSNPSRRILPDVAPGLPRDPNTRTAIPPTLGLLGRAIISSSIKIPD